MNTENPRDEIADLADRLAERLRRGEDVEFEFATEFAALTEAEREEFMELMAQRKLQREEVLEALEANVRVLEALRDLVPDGETLGEALVAGHVTVEEVVVAIRNA